MKLPRPRGPISAILTEALPGAPRSLPHIVPATGGDPTIDEDTQLALHIVHALHYDGFEGVDDAWEWEPSLVAWCQRLEHRVLDALRPAVANRLTDVAHSIPEGINALIAGAGGPSLSAFVETDASLDQLREFLVHRSIYQRKEADAHTFAIPRLRGKTKAAMVRIQADEYGSGVPGRSHAELFADTMRLLRLDPTPGTYVDLVPATTLATDNLVSLFSLQRARRAELVGHLATFEMTSVLPMSRYAAGIRRLTGSEPAAAFYDAHVRADEVHARWAAEELAAGLADDDPHHVDGILFGAAALMEVEARFSSHLLAAWDAGRSSLLPRAAAGRASDPAA